MLDIFEKTQLTNSLPYLEGLWCGLPPLHLALDTGSPHSRVHVIRLRNFVSALSVRGLEALSSQTRVCGLN